MLKDLEDPELQRLASSLPTTVLKSRADSTTKKYLGAFQRWKQWAINHGIQTFLVEEKHLALYLQYIGEVSQSKYAAEETVHALSWLNGAAGLPSPSSSPFITTVLEGLHRSLAKPVIKKVPINLEILTAMVRDTNENPTLANIRLTSACLLGFAGFLRFAELSSCSQQICHLMQRS